MRYLCLLSLLFICFLTPAIAQQALKRRVFEVNTRVPLAGIRVENTRNKKTTETDINGKFSLAANVNDILVLTSFAYEVDTIMVLKLTDAEFFMQPKQNMLKEVNVTNQQIAGSFKVYDRDYHNQTMQYLMDGKGNYKGGVAFRIWSNKAEEHKRKKLDDLEFKYKWEAVIDTVFSVKNLARLVPLKDSNLYAFSFMYRPTVKQYTDNNFNLLNYLSACYKKFVLLPPEKRKVTEIKM